MGPEKFSGLAAESEGSVLYTRNGICNTDGIVSHLPFLDSHRYSCPVVSIYCRGIKKVVVTHCIFVAWREYKPGINSCKYEGVLTAVRHTFLFREGVWRVEGNFTDLHGHPCPMEGETRVSREAERLVSESNFILHQENPVHYHHLLEMPHVKPEELTIWKTLSIISGLMEGKAYILGNHIILTYETKNGGFSGVENIIRINDVYYQNFGSIFRREERFSSWDSEMIRIQ